MKAIIQFFTAGGPFMVPLVICSVVGLAIIIERTIALQRKRIVPMSLEDAIHHFQPGGDTQILQGIAMGESSSLGRLVQRILAHADSPKADNIDALQVCGRAETVRMERGLVTLEIIVGIAPLLGLLGTVSGLITVFAAFGRGEKESMAEAMQIAAGISEALNMTVAGLVVAIPALVIHAYYSRRIEHYMSEIEGLCLDLLAKLYKPAPTPPAGN
ncbi:MAG: MotA/TolQ/ExbB proton channel family protein [Verrucomicrobiae bacterium]|nr:MotA/TolQ/ExbB proton channel family protein [Verrucomicrobiae bacterium]